MRGKNGVKIMKKQNRRGRIGVVIWVEVVVLVILIVIAVRKEIQVGKEGRQVTKKHNHILYPSNI